MITTVLTVICSARLNHLENYKDEMVKMGVDFDMIETVTRKRTLGFLKTRLR